MIRTSFRSAMESISARNALLAASYRDASKGLLSRSVSSLATSIAGQRREMGKELAAIAALPAIGDSELEIEIEAERMADRPTLELVEAKAFLGGVHRAETEDYELLSAVSGASVGRSVEAAERLASLAEQSRKRASWAQDHLDLLGI